MCAAFCGKSQIVKWLCEIKADVESQDKVRLMCVFQVLILDVQLFSLDEFYTWFVGIHVNV